MIEMIVGGVLTAITGSAAVLITQYFQRRKTGAEADKTGAEATTVVISNDQTKWDFQQKVMEDMREELDRRDGECEKRIKGVEENFNRKLEDVVAEIKKKCINDCFAKNYDR